MGVEIKVKFFCGEGKDVVEEIVGFFVVEEGDYVVDLKKRYDLKNK